MAVLKHSTATRNAQADAVVTLLNAGPAAGKFEIRTGAMPATPQTAVSGTLLATVTLSDPAGAAASTGVVTITDPGSVTAVATGTASWARFFDSSGAVVVFDCDVTATGGGGALTLPTVSVTSGVNIDFGALTYTVPE